MRRSLVSLSVLGTLLGACLAQELLWSEEFKDSTLDTSIWSFDTGGGGWGNQELQIYTPNNVRIEKGNLVIEIKDETEEVVVVGGRNITSGRIKTASKLEVLYGTIEASIKLPNVGRGLWPTFWLLGSAFPDVGWPESGTLTVFQAGSKSALASGTANSNIGSVAYWDSGGELASESDSVDVDFDASEDFHTYKMEWTPDSITMSVDDIDILSLDISDCTEEGNEKQCEEFHRPFSLILNVAVGGTYPGIYSQDKITAPLPAEMLVKYVRIYDNGDTVLSGTGVSEPGDEATSAPTERPTTRPPTAAAPTPAATDQPTPSPTDRPTTRAPTTAAPTPRPTDRPTTRAPTERPTSSPTDQPTASPTRSPTETPTPAPTRAPTKRPTERPTPTPTRTPTERPTPTPTRPPTTASTTRTPTRSPTTSTQTPAPMMQETDDPTYAPTYAPTDAPTESPTSDGVSPTRSPTNKPTWSPTYSPTFAPSIQGGGDTSDGTTPAPTMTQTQILRAAGSTMSLSGIPPLTEDTDGIWQDVTGQHLQKEISQMINGGAVEVIVNLVSQASSSRRRQLQQQQQQVDLIFNVVMSIESAEDENHDVNVLIVNSFQTEEQRATYTRALEAQDDAFDGVEVESVRSGTTASKIQGDDTDTEPSGPNVGLIAGCAAAGAAVLLLIAILVRRQRRQRREQESSSHSRLESQSSDHESTPKPSERALTPTGLLPIGTDDESFYVITQNGPQRPYDEDDDDDSLFASTSSSITDDYAYSSKYTTSLNNQARVDDSDRRQSTTSQYNTNQVVRASLLDSARSQALNQSVSALMNQSVTSQDTLVSEFQVIVPPGPLGIVLESTEKGVPVVDEVKPSSCLADEVMVDDRLVRVDGVDVTSMGAGAASRLIASKKTKPLRRFVFARPITLPG